MLILVPGHLCDARLYAPQVSAGLPGPVVLADVTRDDSLGAMAERLLASAPPRFALAGLSMGGMVAMEVLARAPERVRAVGLIATDPTRARAKEIAWRAGFAGRDAFLADFLPRLTAPGDPAGLAPVLAAMMGDQPEPVFRRQGRALDGRADMLPRLAGVLGGWHGRARVIVGEADRICPPRLHHPLAAALGAEVLLLPGAGHIPTLETPGPVTAALAGMLEA